MLEERKARRDGVAVVGILKGGDEKKVVRKRVSWDQDGRWDGEGKRDGDLEGQRVRLVKEENAIESGESQELVLYMHVVLSSLGKSLERP